MIDLFLKNTQLFTSQHQLMAWSCVNYLWIIVMFYQLFWLSFWRPFIHWWANDVMLNFSSVSSEETNSSRLRVGWPEGEQIFIFVCTITLTRNYYFKTNMELWYIDQSLFAKRSTLFHIQIYFNITVNRHKWTFSTLTSINKLYYGYEN